MTPARRRAVDNDDDEGGEEVAEVEVPAERVTTTCTADFVGRALTNAVPGTSNATDYLGRSVAASNKDYLGRALVA